MDHLDCYQYSKDILSGEIISCKQVRQACERFERDLLREDIYFSEDAADHAISWFNFLHHVKGEWAKPPAQTIKLEPWQCFMTANMFGWLREKDDFRRFRTAYIEIARKNSKSTLASGWGGYLFFADQEPGAEVYSVATTRDQAKISFDIFHQMVKKSPFLAGKIRSFKNNLSVQDTFSKFEPLSADYNTLDGLSIHGGICDEVHAWPMRDLWEVCETATGARSQPLQIAITTAGIDQEGICKELHDYTEKLLANTIQDDSFFGIIYTIDEKDKWHDENVWIKANPNLNVSVKLDDLQRKANKAKQIPAAINGFLTKHLDKWVSQASRWIDLDLWDSNYTKPVNEDELAGKLCVGGIDLSSVSDLTTWVMLFKNPDNVLDIVMRCWCPESMMYSKKNKYRSQYQSWEKQGFLQVTEGDAIDYDFVRSQVVKDSLKYNIDGISVDRLFQGYEFSMKLNDELCGSKSSPKVIACGMGYLSMAGPCQEFERLLLEKKLNHGMNPILRFMADSVAVSQDPAGNKKPNKDKSQGRIDGIVSILLGIDRLLRTKNVPYEPPMVA